MKKMLLIFAASCSLMIAHDARGQGGNPRNLTVREKLTLESLPSTILRTDDGGLVIGSTVSGLIDGLGTTQGSILFRDSSGWVTLPPGTAGQVLRSGGAGANPSWVNAGSGTGDMLASNNLSDLTNIVTARTNLGLGTIATQNSNNVAITGGSIDGTSLDASDLSSGTLPDARFPATLPAISGVNLTSLDASNLGTGTIPDARFPSTLPAVSGANLTNLDASDLASGTVPDARFPATLPALNGSALTNLNATNLASGTIPNARLDSDLQTYAGISPSANVQSLLGAADYSAIRTQLSLVPGTNVQAYDADLTTWAGIAPSSNIQTFLGSADYAAANNALGQTVVNVRNYGATGDGSTDDLAAIESAIAALPATGPKVLFFPRGRYRMSDGVVINASDITILGEGRDATVLVPDEECDPYVVHIWSGSTTRLSNIAFIGLSVDGTNIPADPSNGFGRLRVSYGDYVTFKNIGGNDLHGGPITVSDIDNLTVDDVKAKDIQQGVVTLLGTCHGFQISNVHGQDVTEFIDTGIVYDGVISNFYAESQESESDQELIDLGTPRNVTISNGVLKGSAVAIRIKNDGGIASELMGWENVTINNVQVLGFGERGIEATSQGTGAVSNLKIRDCIVQSGESTVECGIVLGPNVVGTDFEISNTHIDCSGLTEGSSKAALFITNINRFTYSRGVVSSNSTILAASTGTLQNISFRGVDFLAGAGLSGGSAMACFQITGGLEFSRCTFTGTAGGGIYLLDINQCGPLTIEENWVKSCTSHAIRVRFTGTTGLDTTNNRIRAKINRNRIHNWGSSRIGLTVASTTITGTYSDIEIIGNEIMVETAGTQAGVFFSKGALTAFDHVKIIDNTVRAPTQWLDVTSSIGSNSILWNNTGLTNTLPSPLPVASGGTGLSALGTGVATFLGTPSKANADAMLSDANFITTAAAEINALTEKATPHDDDLLIIEDSEASNAKKKVKISSLPSGGGGGSGDITAVGDVSSGAAFNGTAGTALTFFNNGGNGQLSYDGESLQWDHDVSLEGKITFLNTGGDYTIVNDGTNLVFDTVVKVPNAGLLVGASVPFSDSSGTLTLQNVDAVDATTESTIEAAIDTAANLTSIQGQAVTLSGTLTVSGNATVPAGTAIVSGGALGTPSSGTLTNCTGLPISTGVSGLGTGVATFLATPSGANLASALTTALPTSKGGTGATSFSNSRPVVSDSSGNLASIATPTFTTYAAGTAANLGTSAALLDFGTTDPSITLTAAGTYRIEFTVNLAYVDATDDAQRTVTLKLRRTNNTAADLSNGTLTLLTAESFTSYYTTWGTFTWVVEYTTSNSDDAIAIFGQIDAALDAGNINATQAFIRATRIY